MANGWALLFDFLMCKIVVSWPIRALCCFVNLFNCLAFFRDCRVMWTNILCGSMRWTQWTLKTLHIRLSEANALLRFVSFHFELFKTVSCGGSIVRKKRMKDTSGVPETLMKPPPRNKKNFSFFGKYFNNSKSIVSTLRWRRRSIFCAELWKIPNNKRLKWRSFGGPPLNNNNNHKGGGTKGSSPPKLLPPHRPTCPFRKKLQSHE